ncbi:anthranilate synthase component I [Paenibacillus larvae]
MDIHKQYELQEILRLSEHFNLIPIVRELLADTETPIRMFQHFYEDQHAFLLESVEGGVKWARYSFIGTDPFLIIRSKKGLTTVEKNGKHKVYQEKPIEILKSNLDGYRSPEFPHLPRFTGGAIGFFGYDLLRYYEKLPAHEQDDLDMQDMEFMFFDQIIVFDHVKQQVLVISNVHIPPEADDLIIAAAYLETCRKVDRTLARLQKPLPSMSAIPQVTYKEVKASEIRSNISKETYIENVKKAQEYIRAGDIFQVVLSQRFEMETAASPLQVYRVLRTVNPSPYMYYLKLGDEVIVGSSPELLVRVEDGKVETKPIAGTRPRGQTSAKDISLERELLADEKELAEHVMLVDLGRNDIGRVAEYGSVHCETFMEIERFSHVMHIVSTVAGQMRKDKDIFDAFLSCLPAGTVSGAPKLRAMEIIAELEKTCRGTYAGAIGYLGFTGNLDSCITIRTIVFKNGKAYVQAGGGIVGDSVPEKEYEESFNKAKALLNSIRMAENLFRPLREHSDINSDYFVDAK